MPISLTCQCGKEYQLSDSLAGKKGRCKACGAVFQIPEPNKPVPVSKPKSVAKSAPVDLFAGLDDGPAVPRSSPSTRAAAAKFGMADPDDDEGSAPKRRSSRPKKRARVDEEAQEKYRKSGYSMIFFGGIAFVLPMIGLQWRLLNLLPAEVQFLIASGLIVLGIGSVTISYLAAPPRWLGPVCLFGIVGAAVLFGVLVLPGMIKDEPAPPPFQQPRVPVDRPVFTPRPREMPNFPNVPSQPHMQPQLAQPDINNNNEADANQTMAPPTNGEIESMVPPNAAQSPGTPPPIGPRPGLPGRRPRPGFPR